MEEWRPIPSNPKYQISNTGLVKGVRFDRPMRPRLNTHGYLCILIGKKHYSVHRLVALTFIPNEDDTFEVDHIDRNKTNNNATNLRWISRSENMLNRDWCDGREDKYIHKNRSTWCVVIKRDCKMIYNKHFTNKEEARKFRDDSLKEMEAANKK